MKKIFKSLLTMAMLGVLALGGGLRESAKVVNAADDLTENTDRAKRSYRVSMTSKVVWTDLYNTTEGYENHYFNEGVFSSSYRSGEISFTQTLTAYTKMVAIKMLDEAATYETIASTHNYLEFYVSFRTETTTNFQLCLIDADKNRVSDYVTTEFQTSKNGWVYFSTPLSAFNCASDAAVLSLQFQGTTDFGSTFILDCLRFTEETHYIPGSIPDITSKYEFLDFAHADKFVGTLAPSQETTLLYGNSSEALRLSGVGGSGALHNYVKLFDEPMAYEDIPSDMVISFYSNFSNVADTSFYLTIELGLSTGSGYKANSGSLKARDYSISVGDDGWYYCEFHLNSIAQSSCTTFDGLRVKNARALVEDDYAVIDCLMYDVEAQYVNEFQKIVNEDGICDYITSEGYIGDFGALVDIYNDDFDETQQQSVGAQSVNNESTVDEVLKYANSVLARMQAQSNTEDSNTTVALIVNNTKSSENTTIIILIVVIGVTAIAGYYLVDKKRKTNN